MNNNLKALCCYVQLENDDRIRDKRMIQLVEGSKAESKESDGIAGNKLPEDGDRVWMSILYLSRVGDDFEAAYRVLSCLGGLEIQPKLLERQVTSLLFVLQSLEVPLLRQTHKSQSVGNHN